MHTERGVAEVGVVVVVWGLWALSGLAKPTWAAPHLDHNGPHPDHQLWLADEIFYDDINVHDKPQGDQAVESPPELCPPVPASLPGGSCDAQKCTSNRECGDSGIRKCCYNGCIYTCLPELAPAAFLDWIREPRRRLSSGLSWLVTGPDDANEAEPCSTSPVESDADPLLCPQGYFCDLYDVGDVTRGIPNQGVCVKLAEDDKDAGHVESEAVPEAKENSRLPVRHAHACDLDGRMLLEGHAIIKDGQQCICRRQTLACEEAREEDESDGV